MKSLNFFQLNYLVILVQIMQILHIIVLRFMQIFHVIFGLWNANSTY